MIDLLPWPLRWRQPILCDVSLSHPLLLDQSGDPGQAGDPALVYHSSEVGDEPIVQLQLQSPNNAMMPGSVSAAADLRRHHRGDGDLQHLHRRRRPDADAGPPGRLGGHDHGAVRLSVSASAAVSATPTAAASSSSRRTPALGAGWGVRRGPPPRWCHPPPPPGCDLEFIRPLGADPGSVVPTPSSAVEPLMPGGAAGGCRSHRGEVQRDPPASDPSPGVAGRSWSAMYSSKVMRVPSANCTVTRGGSSWCVTVHSPVLKS